MWGLARLAALGVALALVGCVTAENSLSQNDIAGMKLTGVTVSYAPDAMVQWEDGIRAYATSKANGRPDRDRDRYAGRQGLRSKHAGTADQIRYRTENGRPAQRFPSGAA
jgi:hypothetical protein